MHDRKIEKDLKDVDKIQLFIGGLLAWNLFSSDQSSSTDYCQFRVSHYYTLIKIFWFS